jgi:hypothetical protein
MRLYRRGDPSPRSPGLSSPSAEAVQAWEDCLHHTCSVCGKLGLAPGVPVQRIIRTSTDPAGTVCEVNAISLPSNLVEIGCQVERDTSAETRSGTGRP